jgi:hypothetical protein
LDRKKGRKKMLGNLSYFQSARRPSSRILSAPSGTEQYQCLWDAVVGRKRLDAKRVCASATHNKSFPHSKHRPKKHTTQTREKEALNDRWQTPKKQQKFSYPILRSEALRRHISFRSIARVNEREIRGQIKIGNLQTLLFCQQQIGRFQIAVNNRGNIAQVINTCIDEEKEEGT